MEEGPSPTVKHWLDSLQLLQYLPKFAEAGYTDLSKCLALTEADLDKIGVTPPGHKKRLLSHLPPRDLVSGSPSAAQKGEPPPPGHCKRPGVGYINMSSSRSPDKSDKVQPKLTTASASPLPEQQCLAPTKLSYVSPGKSDMQDPFEESDDSIYQVPPPRPHCMPDKNIEEESVYVNVADLKKEAPPLLPPKHKEQRESVRDKLGLGGTTPMLTPKHDHKESPKVNKRPIPAPRPSLVHKQPDKKPTPAPRKSKPKVPIGGVTLEESSDEAPEILLSSSAGAVACFVGTDAGLSPAKDSTPTQGLPANPNFSTEEVIYENTEDDEARENARNESLESLSASKRHTTSDEADDYVPMSPPAVSDPSLSASSAKPMASPLPQGVQGLKNLLNNVEDIYGPAQDEISSPPDSSQRVVLGAEQPDPAAARPEGTADTSFDSQIPSGFMTVPDSPAYQAIWVMGSGPSEQKPARPNSNLIQFDSLEATSTPNLDVDVGPRGSTLFNQPPPSFAPPPLPPGVGESSDADKPKELPTLPPRKKEPQQSEATAQERPPANLPSMTTESPHAGEKVESGRDSLGFWDFAHVRAAKECQGPPDVEEVVPPSRGSLPDLSFTETPRAKASVSMDPLFYSSPVESVGSRKQKFRNPAVQSKSIDNYLGGMPEPPPRPPTTPGGASARSISVDSSIPPSPPPRGKDPWKDLYDSSSSRATYCLQEDYNGAQNTDYSWESDDTLSDGGDFYEPDEFHPPAIEQLKASIPIVPAGQVTKHVTSRHGYLHKYSSAKSKRRGWLKRWVAFDGQDLRYFSNNKSVVSKRIIPVTTMVDVHQDIKHAEQHAFRFLLKSVDRVYTFAAEDADDLAMWTSILMQAIIDGRRMSASNFTEGGDMAQPDKEGLVKMEGAKGKLFMALKREKFCYYNNYNDYLAGSPIHQIEMKLASVKEPSKNRLRLITPYVSHLLTFDTVEEAQQWKESFEAAIANSLADDSVLKEVLENLNNKLCADCGSPEAEWASVNLAVTLCKTCAGIHRNLAAPSSKIRSLRMDYRVWTPSVIQMLLKIGNENANNFWEWNASEDDRIEPDADLQTRKDFILDKYTEKRFCRLHPLHNDQRALNEALCKSVQYGDVFETMQLLFSGADILCTSSAYSEQEETPLQLAKSARQTLQMEFLHQNGAEGSGGLPSTSSVRRTDIMPRSSSPTLRGHLFKTGPSHRGEFLKRYCILEHGTLSYYESERSTVAKDSIEKKDMMSIVITKQDRNEFTFELSTLKQGGRAYLFAATSDENRMNWVIALSKNFAPIESRTVDQIKDLDRGGLVSVKDGATKDWQKTWIHLKHKTLYLYKKEEDTFEECDLRKIKSIVQLHSEDEGNASAVEVSCPFVVDLPAKGRALYIQAELKKDSEAWFNAIQAAATESGTDLTDQQLTSDDVPILVDRCINFIDLHGLQSEGIYRLNGQHSKVSKMLELFNADARQVHIRSEEYQINEVATVLKRYFRQLGDPLLTVNLYPKWISSAGLPDENSRLQWYKYLLGELPPVHYCTLKKVIGHLARVAEQEAHNKMNQVNLASIFGPVLMTLDKGTDMSQGYGSTNQEIGVVKDLLEHHRLLFEVKDDELEKERKIEEAKKMIERLNTTRVASNQGGDLLIGVHVNNYEGQVITLKVSASMTASEVLDYVTSKARELNGQQNLGLYEIICNKELERPLHFKEKVLDVTLRWSAWPESFRVGNYLCVKHNHIYEDIELVFDPLSSLFCELKFCEKNRFKKFYFEFGQFKLSYQRDTKASSPIGSWNVEDLTVYLGVQQKRAPPTKWGFTFIQNKAKEVSYKDSPFFGHSICCSNKQELYRWLAAMLHAQHPDGLLPDGTEAKPNSSSTSPQPADLFSVVPPVPDGNSHRQHRGKSFIQRFIHKR